MSVSGNSGFPPPQQMGAWGYDQPAYGPNRTVQLMRATKPWVRFLSIIGFIMCGLMLLAGVAFAAICVLGRATTQGIVIAVVYPIMSLIYLYPTVCLFQYASRIGTFLSQGSSESLDHALEAQKNFWRFVGILTVIVLCLYAVAIAVAILVTLVAGP